jgi:predicted DNA binding CopG/RHH family protein
MKKFDPFENLVLDEEEQWIEDHIEEFVSVMKPGDRERHAEYAKNTLELKKLQNLGIKIPAKDFLDLQKRSKELGISYKTLIQRIIHNFTTQNQEMSIAEPTKDYEAEEPK